MTVHTHTQSEHLPSVCAIYARRFAALWASLPRSSRGDMRTATEEQRRAKIKVWLSLLKADRYIQGLSDAERRAFVTRLIDEITERIRQGETR